MKFPNVIWAASHRGLAQYKLAAIAGMGESRLSRCLSGRFEFEPSERLKIAETLGYPVNWLFQEIVPPPVDGEAQPLSSVSASS